MSFRFDSDSDSICQTEVKHIDTKNCEMAMLPLIREPPTIKQMMVVQGDGERLSLRAIFHYIG